MKKAIFTLALFVLALLTFSTSYGQELDKKTENAKEDLNSERLDVVIAKVELRQAQEKDFVEFKKESEEKLIKNSETIDNLKVNILKKDEKFRIENQKRVSVLEEKNISLRKELSDYKDEGLEKWTAFKQKFNYDMDELTKALKEFTILT